MQAAELANAGATANADATIMSEVALQTHDDVRCAMCNCMRAKADMQDSTRCLGCNRLRLKLHKLRDCLPEDWAKEMSEGERAKFYDEHRGKLSADLKVAVAELVTLKQSRTQVVELVGSGVYLDEDDLRSKYKAKPGVAERIMERTHSFVHGLTDITMYEDMMYTRVATNTSKRELTDESSLTQDRIAAKPKRPRLAKAAEQDKENTAPEPAGESKPPPPAAKPWTEAQVGQVIKIAKTYSDLTEQLRELQTTCSTAISEFLPSHLLGKLQAMMAKLDCETAEVDANMETKTGAIKGIKDAAAAAKKATKELSNRLEGAIEEATTAAQEAGKLPADASLSADSRSD